MITIKFRGQKKNGKWVYGYYCQGRGKSAYIFDMYRLGKSCSCCDSCDCPYDSIEASQVHKVIPETVGQYTGRNDKNGTESYHGDICSYKDDSGTAQKGIIRWSLCQTKFYFEAIGGDDEGNQDGDLDREFEVIGNIHDNPELLEKAT